MKKVKFIYNPYSGENLILDQLDKVIKIHQEAGYTIVPYRIDKEVDVASALVANLKLPAVCPLNTNMKYILPSYSISSDLIFISSFLKFGSSSSPFK